MTRNNDTPSPESIKALLKIISPESVLLAIHSLDGDFSNSTHLIDAHAADGSLFRFVTRRYAVYGNYDRGEKARREYKTLQLLYSHSACVPEPIYLDDTGAIFGTPGIVTRYVPGRLIMAAPYPAHWAEKMAKTLAGIHSTPVGEADATFLLDANLEALWFLHSGEAIPDYVSAHPKGVLLWKTILESLPKVAKVAPALVHIDYWPGNILWDQENIMAVVDWEEAAYGDPGIDVAYCRMDMVLAGMDDAADIFLKTYEAETKKPVANLGFWELAAAIRPLENPIGWVSESPAKERFASFIDDVIRRTGL